jgi:hypothetical protein
MGVEKRRSEVSRVKHRRIWKSLFQCHVVHHESYLKSVEIELEFSL